MRPPRISERLFSLGLRVMPAWFRNRYGEAMLDDFEVGSRRMLSERGRAAWFGFVLRALAELPGAALAARRRTPVGSIGSTRVGWVNWADDLVQAARSLRRSPAWTGTALLVLTLGIGGTVAVFSVLNAVLLRPLPYHDPESLVSIWSVNTTQDLPDGSSWENARDWVDGAPSLEDVALVVRPEFTTMTVTSFGTPERFHVAEVTSNFFTLLGVKPTLGRVFGPGDGSIDARVVVIGHDLWTGRYGSDPAVLGSNVTINGEEFRIVGVIPNTVSIPLEETRIWRLWDPVPPEGSDYRGFDTYRVIGRLEPDATRPAAQSELDTVAGRLEAQYPLTNGSRGVRVGTLRADIVGDRLPMLLWTLFASMLLVLAIGGTNVAQLMLSRGIERRRELALRVALGASRGRVHRQLLLESCLLGFAAGVGGLLLARLGLAGLLALLPASVPLTDGVAIDRTVLGMTFGISAILVPLVGLLPALGGSRAAPRDVLRASGVVGRGREHRARSVLVIVEVAMAVVLLTAAGLLVRSAIEIQAVDPGLDDRHTLIARIDLSDGEDEELIAPKTELIARIGAMPGVEGAGIIGRFFIERFPDQSIRIVGDPPGDAGRRRPRLTTDYTMPGFFSALDVPILRGRDLDITDFDRPIRAAVVNERWVETFAAGRDPVGLQFRRVNRADQVEGKPVEVVGVVGDLRRRRLEERSFPQMFVLEGEPSFDILIRTSGDVMAAAAMLRVAVAELDPLAAVSGVGTVRDRYRAGLEPRRVQTLLFGVFAALACLLASIGLFAVLHEAVSSRRREIGVRLALGADPAGLRGMVFRKGLLLSVAGLAVGIAAVVALSTVLGSLVYGIQAVDPLTLLSVVAAVFVLSLIASVTPAIRATRISPAETLATE